MFYVLPPRKGFYINPRNILNRDCRKRCEDRRGNQFGCVQYFKRVTTNIECGEKLPRLETFIAIANALKTDANSLLVDVLDVSTLIEASSVAEKISALPTAEQRRITHLLSVMVDDVIADYQ